MMEIITLNCGVVSHYLLPVFNLLELTYKHKNILKDSVGYN